MPMVVTALFDALVKSFVTVVIAAPVDAVALAAAVGCVAAAVVPAPAVAAVVVAVAAASSEATSETLPWIFRHFLQSTNKGKKRQKKLENFTYGIRAY